MSSQIQSLLDSLTEHGTIDSTGQFTVDVARASRLLPSHQTSDSNLFLTAMVSAGYRAGASHVRINVNATLTKVTAVFKGMVLDLPSLQTSHQEAHSVGDPVLLDLSLGIREAFVCGAKAVTVRGQDGVLKMGAGFNKRNVLRLSDDGQRGVVTIEVDFPWKFWKKSSSRPVEPAIRLLQKLVRWSRRPLKLAGHYLMDDIDFLDSEYMVKVGRIGSSPARSPNLELASRPWSALLCVGAGEIELVDAEIHRGTISNSFFHGVLYHPSFRLDASREQIIEDATLRSVYQDLEDVKGLVLADICKSLGKESARDAWLLNQVWLPSLAGEVDAEHQLKVCDWLETTLYHQGRPGTKRSADLTERLFWQGVWLSDAQYRDWTVEHLELLRIAQVVLGQELSRQEPLLNGVLEVLEEQRPKQTLIRAYLLLGLGAAYQRAGEAKVAERVWLQAIKQVAGRRHREQEMLIRAHLEFGLDHIVDETATLLEMQIRALENDEWL